MEVKIIDTIHKSKLKKVVRRKKLLTNKKECNIFEFRKFGMEFLL